MLHVDYPLENDNDNDNAGFDRESTSRQSFSEKRKQASSMSPPPLPREYRSLNRKKNGNFIEMTIWPFWSFGHFFTLFFLLYIYLPPEFLTPKFNPAKNF